MVEMLLKVIKQQRKNKVSLNRAHGLRNFFFFFFPFLYPQEHQNSFCLKRHKELFGPVCFLTALQTAPGFSCCASPFAFNLFPVSSLRKSHPSSLLSLLCALRVTVRAERLFAD